MVSYWLRLNNAYACADTHSRQEFCMFVFLRYKFHESKVGFVFDGHVKASRHLLVLWTHVIEQLETVLLHGTCFNSCTAPFLNCPITSFPRQCY